MSKTEDYLDSLLSAVSDGSAGRIVRKDAKSGQRESQRERRYSRRKSAMNDKNFIDEFENELLMDDSEDTDEFLRAFEMELDENESDDVFGAVLTDEESAIEETETLIEEASEEAASEESISEETESQPEAESAVEAEEFDADSLLSEAMGILEEASPLEEDVSGEEEESALLEDAPSLEDLPNPEEMDLGAELGLADENSSEEGAEGDDLLNILENGGSEDDEMSDIGDLLKALNNDEVVNADDMDTAGVDSEVEPSILEELEALSADGDESETGEGADGIDDFGEDVVEVEAEADLDDDTEKKPKKKEKKKKEKKKKEKGEKKEGFFSKLAKVLFGDDEEAAEKPVSTEGLEGLTDENLSIIADLDADEAKEAKGKKKKEKKPKKEKVKKEKPKKEKKPKPPKEPKPKKPINPDDLDLTPPLPKAPVILIFIMAISFVILTVLSTNLLDKSNMVTNAKEASKDGNYVLAYSYLTGKDLDEKATELKDKYEILAVVQAPYNDYFNLMYSKQYYMAIDSLICAAGRYSVNYEDAMSKEISVEYGELHVLILDELNKLGISEEEAVSIYEIRDRGEYSKAVYKLTKSLGYEVEE